jgi:hypothetical protein
MVLHIISLNLILVEDLLIHNIPLEEDNRNVHGKIFPNIEPETDILVQELVRC